MAKKEDYKVDNYKTTVMNPPIDSKTAKVKYVDQVKNNKPGDFNYGAKKPIWNYNDKAFNDVYDQIMNRKDFSFDVNGSALYNQYKDMYQKQGQMAMMDTMGQAAAMSGGYGNSYAASAGMQAYQQNLDQLTDKVPELYQLAMQQYQLEGQNLQDKYNVGYSERDMAYGQYRDSVEDWQDGRDFAYDQHRDSVDDWQWRTEHWYNQYQDAVKNEQWVADHNLDVAGHNLDVAGHNASLDQFDKQIGIDQQKVDETIRSNKASEGLDQQRIDETVRSNQASEGIDQQRVDETIRANKVAETLDNEQFKHDVMMDEEKLKQWAADFGLSEQELQHLIEMDEWEKQNTGRLG